MGRGGQKTHSRSRGGEEDQAAEVGGALVAEGAGGVDEGADAVGLQRGAHERRAPGRGGRRRLPRPQELLLRVRRLRPLVRLSQKRSEHCAPGGGGLIRGVSGG